MTPWSARRLAAIVSLCGVPLLLVAALVGGGLRSVLGVPVVAVDGVAAVELGIGELEMGADFGQPADPLQRGPVATVLLCGLLLLCPAKFLLLWMLQRREPRDMDTPAGAPAPGDA